MSKFKVGDKVLAVVDVYEPYENWLNMAFGQTATILEVSVRDEVYIQQYKVAIDEKEEDHEEDPEEDTEDFWWIEEYEIELVGSPEAKTRSIEYLEREIPRAEKEVIKSVSTLDYYKELLNSFKNS